MDTLDQKHFMRCNACERAFLPTEYVGPMHSLPSIMLREAGAQVDHWPCSAQEHGQWSALLLLRHAWQSTRLGDYECKRCGAWTAGYNTPPDYGCTDPTTTVPMVVPQSYGAELRALYREHGLDPDNPWHVGRVADAARRLDTRPDDDDLAHRMGDDDIPDDPDAYAEIERLELEEEQGSEEHDVHCNCESCGKCNCGHCP